MTTLETIDLRILDTVTGGEGTPTPPTAGQQAVSAAGACLRGAATGGAIGAGIGAVTGLGGGAVPGAITGAIGGCVRGMVMQSTPAY